nr:hypothetical protein [Thioalkalivibrio nitratireducens]
MLPSGATCRTARHSVLRRSAFAPSQRPRQPRRRIADDGFRPLPPFASFTFRGARTRRDR